MTRRLHVFSVLAAMGLLSMPAAAQTITASPTALNLYHQIGVGSSPTQSVTLSFSSQLTTTVTLSYLGQGGWLIVLPPTGQQAPSTGFSFQVFPSVATGPGALPVGLYQANITISAPGVTPLVIPVTLTISNQPLLIANKPAIDFVFAVGGPTLPNQTLDITSTIPGLAFTAAPTTATGGGWLSVNPASATTGAQLNVLANPAGLPVGVYSGEIAVSAAAAGNVIRVPVTLRVIDQLQLSVTPASMEFGFQVGGPTPPAQILSAATSGIPTPVTATVTTASGGSWLSVQPPSGNSPLNMAVSANPAGLTPGTYTGTIRIAAVGTTNSPIDVPVTLRVTNDPLLRASPASIVFTYQTNGPLPESRPLVVSTGGGAPTTVTVAAASDFGTWLTATPASASTPLAVVVSANPAGLTPGLYNGRVIVTGGTGANPVTIPVALAVGTTPLLRLSEGELKFVHTLNAVSPPAQPVEVTSTGNATTFDARTLPGVGWLSVTPTGGGTPGSVSVSVNPAGLAPGVYTSVVSFAPLEAGAIAISMPVELTVSASPLIRVQSRALRFQFNTGAALPANQSLQIDASGGSFAFSAGAATSTGGPWLSVGPTSGVTGSSIQVGVSPLVLSQGTYSGLVAVEAPGAANTPQYVPAILGVATSVDLVSSPAQLSFDHTPGAAVPPAQTINLATANTVVNYTAAAETLSGGSWLAVTPGGGLTPAALQVTVNPQGLPAGTYAGSIRVTSPQANNSPRLIQVTLTVRQAAPTLTVTTDSLSYAFTPGGAVPAAQQVQVTATGDPVPFSGTVSTTSGGNWLVAASSSATTPATLTITVNPAGLAAGTYTGRVNVASTASAANARVINVTLTVAAIPAPQFATFVHGATFAPSAAVPGMIFTISGTNLGPATPLQTRLNQSGNVDTNLGGIRVLFDNIPAPLLYVSATQINGVVPYGISGRISVRLRVESQGIASDTLELRVADANPGLFVLNQAGQGAILNADNSVNGANRPADRGSPIVIYATGEGQTSPFGVDGTIPGVNAPLRSPLLPVTVEIGGIEARILYNGSAPTFVSGVWQINAEIAPNTPTGSNVSIRIRVGSFISPAGVTVAVR